MEKTHSAGRDQTTIKTAEVFEAAPYSTELLGRPQRRGLFGSLKGSKIFAAATQNYQKPTKTRLKIGKSYQSGYPEYEIPKMPENFSVILKPKNVRAFGKGPLGGVSILFIDLKDCFR